MRSEIIYQQIEKMLLDSDVFVSPAKIDDRVPDLPGLYCIKIRDIVAFPKNLESELKSKNHNIIYIGLASHSLKKRF